MTLAIADKDFIQGGITHHQNEGRSLVFISISEPLNARPYRDSGAALTKLLRDLNRAVGHRSAGLSWCAVGEWGEKSRRFHWHVTIADLAYPWCSRSRSLFPNGLKVRDRVTVLGQTGTVVSKESTLKPLVARNGFGTGFIGMRQVGFTAGDRGNVANYLSKYLAKGDAGLDLPKGFQLVRSSRAASAWWPGHTLVSVRAERKEKLKQQRRAPADGTSGARGLPAAAWSSVPMRNGTQLQLVEDSE